MDRETWDFCWYAYFKHYWLCEQRKRTGIDQVLKTIEFVRSQQPTPHIAPLEWAHR